MRLVLVLGCGPFWTSWRFGSCAEALVTSRIAVMAIAARRPMFEVREVLIMSVMFEFNNVDERVALAVEYRLLLS